MRLQSLGVAACIFLAGSAAHAQQGSPICLIPAGQVRNFGAQVAAGNNVLLTWLQPLTGDAPFAYRIVAGSFFGGSNIVPALDIAAATSFFIPNVAPGTYFVRIYAINECGIGAVPSNELVGTLGGPVPPGQPPPAPGPPNIQVIQSTVTEVTDFSGNVRIFGAVQNIGGSVASFVEVDATIRGTSGQVLDTDFTYAYARTRRLSGISIVTDTTLGPNETGCFSIFTSVPRSQVGRVDLSTARNTYATEEPRGRLDLLGSLTQSNSFGRLRVAGELRNSGSVVTYFSSPIIEVKDSNGRVIDCTFTYVSGSTVQLPSGFSTNTGIRPNETGPFSTTTGAAFAAASTVTVWGSWDENAPALTVPLQTTSAATALAYEAAEQDLHYITERYLQDPNAVERAELQSVRNTFVRRAKDIAAERETP